jgi:hypothetical protein
VRSPVSSWRWTALAALAGFATSLLFSTLLHWKRPAFVAVWSLAALVVIVLYVRVERVRPLVQLERRWKTGLVVGVLVGALLWFQVTTQPPSPRSTGADLLVELFGYGLVYGLVDAVMLSALPILTLYGSRPAVELMSAGSRLRWALIALAGSALVAAAYHAGFVEFRGPSLAGPVIGTTIMSAGYLLSGSPITPILAHVLMHIAAVLHGMETTVQLPPH